MFYILSAGSLELQPGCSVTGIIDGKFDTGYLITVNFGSEKLKGVLYHIPHMLHASQSSNASVIPTHRRRKRSRLALQDPSRPKSNRSGYNFFFAEHYARLKPHYHGQEKAISKKIGILWSNLTVAEKQVLHRFLVFDLSLVICGFQYGSCSSRLLYIIGRHLLIYAV